MHPSLRNVTTAGFFVSVIMGLALPGCANRLGPVRATQSGGSTGHANLPDIVVERSKECVELYGQQLAPGRVVIESAVEVNEDGDKVGVNLEGLPVSAPDLGACIRNVLHDMPIAEEPFREAVETLKFHRKHAMDSQEALERFINVILGVPFVESELVLDVDEYTVALPVIVKMRIDSEKLIGDDKQLLAAIGQWMLDNIGYDEIIKRSEEQGWVKTVRVEKAPSADRKKFLGDGPPSINVDQIVKEAVKQVMTKAAPAALIASQADSPIPGPGDLVGLGILGVGLVVVGGIVVYKVATSPGPVSVAPSAPTTALTPQVPPPPATGTRRNPGQTCEDVELDRLQKEKDKACNSGFAVNCNPNNKGLDEIPCSTVKLSIQQRQGCLAARWEVQNKCFGGKPDARHEKPIDEHQRGLDNCETLKIRVCAPGHPMAEK